MKRTRKSIESRRKSILKLLEHQEKISVEELSSKLKISEITIRRDLQHLNEAGLVERFHGGASLNTTNYTTNIFSSSLTQNKHAIAKEAAKYVEDGDTIFINTSSTALLVLDYITAKQVTVITNNASAIFSSYKENIYVVLTGGELRMPKESLVGEFALNNLARVRAAKCFLGCSGLSSKDGFTTAVLQEVAINELMLKNTLKKRFILADKTKVGVSHSFFSGSIKEIDYLITDNEADDKEIVRLERAGVNVIQVDLN
jgi:DeoR/GlpR family transcriptional regulator of sugar metabolism